MIRRSRPALPNRWLKALGGLSIQLVIVFVGVYAAFMLDRYREAHRGAQLDRQLYTLLIGEVQSVTEGLERQRIRFDSLYTAPLVAESPVREPLRPYYEVKGTLASPELQALLEAGGAAGRPELIQAIRLYNMNAHHLMKLSDELRRLSIDHIAPHAAEGPAAFYTPGGQLRPRFRAYQSLVYELSRSMNATVDAARRVVTLLEAESV